MKVNVTTIIPNPTWGKTLDLLQHHKSIRINTSDADKFKAIIEATGLKYSTKEDGKDLTRFTLESTSEK